MTTLPRQRVGVSCRPNISCSRTGRITDPSVSYTNLIFDPLGTCRCSQMPDLLQFSVDTTLEIETGPDEADWTCFPVILLHARLDPDFVNVLSRLFKIYQAASSSSLLPRSRQTEGFAVIWPVLPAWQQ